MVKIINFTLYVFYNEKLCISTKYAEIKEGGREKGRELEVLKKASDLASKKVSRVLFGCRHQNKIEPYF